MQSPSIYSLLMKKEKAHDDPIYCCAWTRVNFSNDSSAPSKDVIVTAGSLAQIKVWEWDKNKLELKWTLNEHILAVTSLSISPDGQHMVSTAMDFTLIVWDLVTGQKIHKIPSRSVWRASFAPDCIHIVAGSHSGDLIVYDIRNGMVVNIFDTREQFAIGVAWSSNDNYIASGSTNGSVCILDSLHGKVLHTFKEHQESIKNIAFSPNSKLLLTSSIDGCFKLYDVVAGSLLHSLQQKSWALSVCFSPDGKRVALGTGDGEVLVALTDGLKVVKKFKEHNDAVWQVQFNPKGDLLVSVSKDKTINIYEIPPLPKK